MHSLCRSAPFNWNLFLGKRLTYAVRLLPTKILRQMNDQQASGSAWPEPPYLYKRYTAENWEMLQEARKTGVYPTTPLSQPPFPDYTIQSLEPPAPPTDAYTVFDQRWQVCTTYYRETATNIVTDARLGYWAATDSWRSRCKTTVSFRTYRYGWLCAVRFWNHCTESFV